MQIKGLVEGMILAALMPRCLIRVALQVQCAADLEFQCTCCNIQH